jgi:hypothetical protein
VRWSCDARQYPLFLPPFAGGNKNNICPYANVVFKLVLVMNSKGVNGCCLMAILEYHDENKFPFEEIMMMPSLY